MKTSTKILAGVAVAGTMAVGGTVTADQLQNPYVDTASGYVLQLETAVNQGENVTISKTAPEATLNFWENEGSLRIAPQVPATSGTFSKASRPLLSKRMEFKSGNTTAYVEPGTTADTFNIDFSLAAKPTTNVFKYDIQGSENFDFFYQPPLTAAEVAHGDTRPDNVVGSYAVYSKDKKDFKNGGINYSTGKVAHIYRPQAIDAKGNTVWADLNYSNGVLSVTVPQSFLDTAVYPVTVDPTFGQVTQGASSINLAGANASSLEAGKFTLSGSSAIITALHFWLAATAATSKQEFSGMYASDGSTGPAGSPGTLLTGALTHTVNNTSFADDSVAASTAIIPAASYWFATVPSEDGPGTAQVSIASDATGGIDTGVGEGGISQPFTCGISACAQGTNKISAYAVYTAVDVLMTTDAATSITLTAGTINATVTLNANNDITQKGFAVSTDPNLITGVATSTLGAMSGTGSFSANLTGLFPSFTYYYRGYVISTGDGTVFGTIQNFQTITLPTILVNQGTVIWGRGTGIAK